MEILIAYLIGVPVCMVIGIVRMRQHSDLAMRQGGWLLATCYLWPVWGVFYAVALPWSACVTRKSKKQHES